MNDDIEPITPINPPPGFLKILDEEMQWLKVRSGVNEDLLGPSNSSEKPNN